MMSVAFTQSVTGVPGGSFGTQSSTENVTVDEGDEIMAWAYYEASVVLGVAQPTPAQVMQAMTGLMVAYAKQQAARHKAKFG